MAHPYHHALSSVKKWGGEVSDYIHLHSRKAYPVISGIELFDITQKAFLCWLYGQASPP
jgi:hypothetical protein